MMASRAPAQRVTTPQTSSTGGRQLKRKRETVKKYYAVRAGYQRGVFETWAECQAQTVGYGGAMYKAFENREDAQAFVAGKNPKKGDEPTKFYAVAVGTQPGIYNDWPSAQLAIQGAKGPKHKKFETYAEAVQFIREKGNLAAYQALGLTQDLDGQDEEAEEAEEEEEEEDQGEEGDMLQVTEPTSKKVKLTSAASASASASASGPGSRRNPIEIYTDGASQGNGSARAVAGVGVFFGNGDPRNISEPLDGNLQTNQRAELTAIKRAVESVAAAAHVVIYSDSQYSIKCVTQWFQSWRKNKWKTKGGEVKNRDLVEAVLELLEFRDGQGGSTRFVWVKGHDNNPGNVAADLLAVQGCRR